MFLSELYFNRLFEIEYQLYLEDKDAIINLLNIKIL